MKNLLIGLFILGLTNLSYAQNLISAVNVMETKHSISPTYKSVSLLNVPYLDKVHNEIKPSNIRQLEIMAFKYNIKELLNTSNSRQKFTVEFIWSQNYIVAKYDYKGRILSTYEVFKNFKLPEHILKSISLNHPNWSIVANTYKVTYSNKYGSNMRYIVKIRKGNLKKKIHFDSITKYPFESDVIANKPKKSNL